MLQRRTERELRPECVDPGGEPVGGGVGAHQDRKILLRADVGDLAGQLRERLVENGDVVGGGVRPGVAFTQQPGHRLPGAALAMIDEPEHCQINGWRHQWRYKHRYLELQRQVQHIAEPGEEGEPDNEHDEPPPERRSSKLASTTNVVFTRSWPRKSVISRGLSPARSSTSAT
ncbi:hypothetical protein GCM10009754_41880 [Amycolatopsis minnesotensis]|uniref:Uncharacterized protein n=1 Tax=Amycolatopsis minnesotensis TaxID=337894 RepID=A0ABP5CKK8_9PSEU